MVDQRTGTRWWTTPYSGTTPEQALMNNVTIPLNIILQQQGKANPQIRKYRVKYATNFRLEGITQNRFLRAFNIGGAARWESKGGIGYYGVQQFPAIITELDANRPVYDKAHLYVDAFIGYRFKMFGNRVGANLQLNVRNLGEDGRLQPIGAYPNGVPVAYRIIDPALYILQLKLDL